MINININGKNAEPRNVSPCTDVFNNGRLYHSPLKKLENISLIFSFHRQCQLDTVVAELALVEVALVVAVDVGSSTSGVSFNGIRMAAPLVIN